MVLAYFVADTYFRSASGFVPLTLGSVPLLLKPRLWSLVKTRYPPKRDVSSWFSISACHLRQDRIVFTRTLGYNRTILVPLLFNRHTLLAGERERGGKEAMTTNSNEQGGIHARCIEAENVVSGAQI